MDRPTLGRRGAAFLALLAAFGPLPAGPQEPLPSATPKLSVLLIMVDGVGTRLGCYGADVKTPHIDRLSSMGRRFNRAYCQYPASGASRTSLMTGWRPERTRVWGPPEGRVADAIPLQERFHAGGYFTARVGKVYNGPAEESFEWDLAEDAPKPAPGPPAESLPQQQVARRVASLIEEKRDGLFFIAAAFGQSELPAEALERHPPSAVALPRKRDTWSDIPAIAVLPTPMDRPDRQARPTPLPDAARRLRIASQDARVALVDAQIGVLLETLDRLKLWERMVVVLVGDRGPDLGEHGELLRSDTLFESSLRTPLIITAPAMRQPGAAAKPLVELVDVYPTLTELCGLKKVKRTEGTSLVSLLEDPTRSVKTAVFSVAAREAGHLGRSLRTDRFRYSDWPDGSRELYDHQLDPHEWTNLALQSGQEATLAQLRGMFEARELSAAPPPPQPAPVVRSKKKLNVLLIVLDDLSVRLGSYGYDVKTPNIDRLAGKGRRFERAYSQVAMCSPSRASFLSGWRPERINLWRNDEPVRERLRGAVPLQEHFHAAGYYTARVGKVYHGRWESEFKWDLSESLPPSAEKVPEEAESPTPVEDRTAPRQERDSESAAEGSVAHWWLMSDDKDEEEPDGQRARRVAQLLEEHRAGPFFIAAGFAKPHLRWVAPRKYFEMYPPEGVQLPQEPPDDADDIPLIAVANAVLQRPGLFLTGKEPELDDEMRRRAIAAHNACVSFVDAQVGVVLEALDRLKLWDSTLVVLLGDHGFHLGEHRGLWRKDTLFEEALQAPLIVVGPGVSKPGAPTRAIVELLDLYPTLVELAQLARPGGVQGTSLVPLLKDPEAKGREAAFSFRRCYPPQLGRSIRTERYRFTEWPDGGQELYDLSSDPRELTNLARLPARSEAVAALRKRLYDGYAAALAEPTASAGADR